MRRMPLHAPQAPESPPARTQVQLLREARIQPLKEALQASIAQQAKAATVREALEAEVRPGGGAGEGRHTWSRRSAHLQLHGR